MSSTTEAPRGRKRCCNLTVAWSLAVCSAIGVLGMGGCPRSIDDHSNHFDGATHLAVSSETGRGQPQSGSIESPGDVDCFSFYTNPGCSYVISTGGNMDTYLQVYRSSGSLIGSDDDGGDGTLSRFNVTADEGSRIYLMVRHFSSRSTGSYRVQVQESCSAEASLDGNELMVPGGTIIIRGNEYFETAMLDDGGLCGVVKGGTAYLYHPALGDITLTEETSRQAVGHFIVGDGPSVAGDLVKAEQVASLDVGDGVRTEVGVRVTRLGPERYRFENEASRWVAVKISTRSAPFFLPPATVMPDLNIIRNIRSAVNGDLFEDPSVELDVAPGDMEFYGSIMRAVTPISMSMVVPKARTVLMDDHDTGLFIRVNAIELVNLTFDVLAQVVGSVSVFECLDALAVNVLIDGLEIALLDAIAQGEVTQDMEQTVSEDFAQNMAGCACVAATAGACEVSTTILDIIGALSWAVDVAIFGQIDTVRFAAFDTLEGTSCGDGNCDGDEDCDTCPDDCGSCSVCGDGVCDPDESEFDCPQDCDIAEVFDTITSSTQQIEIFAWDCGSLEDGDEVEILLNGNSMHDLALTFSGDSVYLTLSPGNNVVDIRALNEGTASPNTACFVVSDDWGDELLDADWNMDTGQLSRLLVIYQP